MPGAAGSKSTAAAEQHPSAEVSFGDRRIVPSGTCATSLSCPAVLTGFAALVEPNFAQGDQPAADVAGAQSHTFQSTVGGIIEGEMPVTRVASKAVTVGNWYSGAP